MIAGPLSATDQEFVTDPELPISAAAQEITRAIREHPVVIVAGETGSGKTTQLPKLCLALGRSAIAHTQPRRIAARSVAERIASELGTELGAEVGYRVRFTRHTSTQTKLTVMTDGVLLNELATDRDLRRYDTIIIDEAHERSLNIDFLLGYLKQLLTRRRDLKVIVTSATIDTQRFSTHFDDAPIIEVTGRSYGVEVRYRPLLDEGNDGAPLDAGADQISGISRAIQELSAIDAMSDILVFLSGEREIRDTAQALATEKLRHTEVIALYARLSAADQHRVFAAHSHRRIVLATNVAETSLTVPGIRFVIDAGTARISRYSARTKVQRLPIEPISQASAQQRSGRCGRTAPGVAIRLYSEEDFLSRPEFTEPEILRTNLASVILQMAQARLGDITNFPFVEAPDQAQISDGIRLLTELGAIKDQRGGTEPRLTRVGSQLAQIPLDPRLSRMLVTAARLHCLREVMIIVAGLSIQDPRERPSDHQAAADHAHRRFSNLAPVVPLAAEAAVEQRAGAATSHAATPQSGRKAEAPASDFLAWLTMWDYLRHQQSELSANAFRRLCRSEFLHVQRIREWQDVHRQLRAIAQELKLQLNSQPADPASIHTAILSGLLSQVGLAELEEKTRKPQARQGSRRKSGLTEYLGARGARFAIQPGSALAKRSPPLVMAGEIVETTRLWARCVAGVEAGWIEQVGGHVLKRQYSEPHWSRRAQAAQAYETVSLYGVPVISRRVVNLAKIDPIAAREIFIRSALVEGNWRTCHEFWARNQQRRAEAESMEERARRRDLVVDDGAIAQFYLQRIPAEVVSAAHFDTWWKRTRVNQPELLDLQLNDLISLEGSVSRADFPDRFVVRLPTGEAELPVSYRFDQASSRDGVSVSIPIGVINQIPAHALSWQVPGLRLELATELIRTLPKAIRTSLVPAPEHAKRCLDWIQQQRIEPGSRPFSAALTGAIQALYQISIPPDPAGGFKPAEVPTRLAIHVVITDAEQEVASGDDLAELVAQLRPAVTQKLNRAAGQQTKSGARSWVFDTLEPQVTVAMASVPKAVGYPALTEEAGGTVALVVYDTSERAQQAARRGLRRLVQLNTPDPTKWVFSHLSNHDKLTLSAGPYPDLAALLADARLASVGSLITVDPRTITNAEQFGDVCDRVRVDNADRMREITGIAADALRRHGAVIESLAELPSSSARDDLSEQLSNLVFRGFLSATGLTQLRQLGRYLQAAELRIQTLRTSPAAQAAAAQTILELEDEYATWCATFPRGPLPDEVSEVGWLLEDLRVSLFAQRLGTRQPVSAKRIRSTIKQLKSQIVTSS